MNRSRIMTAALTAIIAGSLLVGCANAGRAAALPVLGGVGTVAAPQTSDDDAQEKIAAGTALQGGVTMITDRDTVTVSGTGSVSTVPDKAEISFGIETEADTAKQAQAENTEQTEKVVAKLKDLGVAEKSIKTSGYNMYPRYDYENGNRITGYYVSTRLTVSDQDIDDVGTLITECVAEGINNIDSVNYLCSDYDEEYQEALGKAVAAARRKAKTLADAAGKKLGDVHVVAEGYQNTTYRYGNAEQLRSSAKMAAYDAGAAMDVMPGEADIEAQVTVTWYLED